MFVIANRLNQLLCHQIADNGMSLGWWPFITRPTATVFWNIDNFVDFKSGNICGGTQFSMYIFIRRNLQVLINFASESRQVYFELCPRVMPFELRLF